MTKQTIFPPIGETVQIEVPITRNGQKVMAKVRATGEPGVPKEVVEAELRRSIEAIERGEYETIDVKDIDGHLTQRNIHDIIA